MKKFIFILFLFLLNGAFAQNVNDTSSVNSTKKNTASEQQLQNPPPKKHSPKKATILSICLPGAGQVYNKKNWWWKVPIIYGAGGALIYGLNFYQGLYDGFRTAYILRLNNQSINDPYYSGFETATLQSYRDYYRQQRDMSYVYIALVYVVQIMDAAVEAHFFDFNMNENVSLKIEPDIGIAGANYYAGVRLNFKLK